jgi:predicted GNAT family acetyltransferase
MTETDDVEVRDAPERERYELIVGGELAGFAEYRGGGESRAFTHTEVDGAHEGRGLGGILVRTALDDVRSRGLKVIPMCPFVRAYLDRHPEYLDLVDASLRRSFGLPEPPPA